jgi:hypothetical protein
MNTIKQRLEGKKLKKIGGGFIQEGRYEAFKK